MQRRLAARATIAVVLLVVGQLLALKHVAESRHVTCAEHGEQVEALTVASVQHQLDGKARLVAVGGESRGHEHCASADLLRTNTRASRAPQIHVVAASVGSIGQMAPVAFVRSLDVILIAPKTSPPVVA